MSQRQLTNLERAHNIMVELKEQGMSNHDMNELSLIVLIELGLRHNTKDQINEPETKTCGSSI